jgi:hypothetical protein
MNARATRSRAGAALILIAGLVACAELGHAANVRALDGRSLAGEVTFTKEGQVVLAPKTGAAQTLEWAAIEEILFQDAVQSPVPGAALSNAWTGCDIGDAAPPGKMALTNDGTCGLRRL